MSDRYYFEPAIETKHVELAGAEAHHLIHVMRVKVDDDLTLFDGGGAEYLARIMQVSRSTVRAEILERRDIDRELDFELTLGVALPKGDRQKWLVEKAVELGVTRIVPLQADRSVANASGSALDRLRRTVIEASKQCGRNRLMQIDPPVTTAAFCEAAPRASRRWLADISGIPIPTSAGVSETTWLAIGPEGGFTDDELACAAKAKWELVSLGPRILRTETASIALASSLVLQATR